MKKLIIKFLLIFLIGLSNKLIAQHPISIGLTSGWGATRFNINQIRGTSDMLIPQLSLSIPLGFHLRYDIGRYWAVEARAQVRWASVRFDEILGENTFSNGLGGIRPAIEFSVLRRIPLKHEKLFLAVEAGISLQINDSFNRGCTASTSSNFIASSGSGGQIDSTWSASRIVGNPNAYVPSGRVSLSLEYDFEIGNRPVSLQGGIYAMHGFTPVWSGNYEAWDELALTTRPIPVFGGQLDDFARIPDWNCLTNAGRPADHVYEIKDYGAQIGTQFSLLIHLEK